MTGRNKSLRLNSSNAIGLLFYHGRKGEVEGEGDMEHCADVMAECTSCPKLYNGRRNAAPRLLP